MFNSNGELRREWERRVVAFKASGLTGAAWCAANKVKPHQLWYWVGIFKKGAAPTPSRWLPVEVGKVEPICGDQDNALIVRIGQVAVEVKPGFNPGAFSDVMRILASLC